MASTALHGCFVAVLLMTPPRVVPQEIAATYELTLLPSLPAVEPQKELPKPVEEKSAEPPPEAKQELQEEPEEELLKEESAPSAQLSVASEASHGESNYWQVVRAAVASHIRYPAFARRQNQEGYALIKLTIDPTGQLREVVPLESSAGLFSKCATAAAEKASPFPPPTNCAAAVLSAVIPIHFRIDNKESHEQQDEPVRAYKDHYRDTNGVVWRIFGCVGAGPHEYDAA